MFICPGDQDPPAKGQIHFKIMSSQTLRWTEDFTDACLKKCTVSADDPATQTRDTLFKQPKSSQLSLIFLRATSALLGVLRQAGVVSDETRALQLRNLTE